LNPAAGASARPAASFRAVPSVTVSDSRPVVVITGGHGGLGDALARWHLASGWRVIVVVRPVEARRSLHPVEGDPAIALLPGVARSTVTAGEPERIEADLADPAAVEHIARTLEARGVASIARLVHNAGVGWVGDPGDQAASAVAALMRVNVLAPILLTRVLWPHLAAARGRVVLVGSIAAFVPAPRYAAYAASKAAVDGLARSLAPECDDGDAGGVRVQVIHPGPIRTEFHRRAGATDLDASRFPSADAVALRVIAAIDAGRWRACTGHGLGLLARIATLAKMPVDAIAARREARRLATAATQDAQPTDRSALVTGAASGLGAALCRRLLDQGWQVVGVDHHDVPSELARGAGAPGRLHWIRADLTDVARTGTLPGELPAGLRIALLVHSAGTSAVGPFRDQSPVHIERTLATNLVAPISITCTLLAAGRLAPGATLVFVSSLSHYVGYPGAAAYAASKDGLAHFGRCLAVALRGRGLRVLTAFPGPMRTPHAERFAPPGADARRRLDPGIAADRLLQAVAQRRVRTRLGVAPAIAALAGLALPTLVTRLMGRALYTRLRDVARDSR